MKVKGVLLIIMLRPQCKPGKLRCKVTLVRQKDRGVGDLTNGGSPGWVRGWVRTCVASLGVSGEFVVAITGWAQVGRGGQFGTTRTGWQNSCRRTPGPRAGITN